MPVIIRSFKTNFGKVRLTVTHENESRDIETVFRFSASVTKLDGNTKYFVVSRSLRQILNETKTITGSSILTKSDFVANLKFGEIEWTLAILGNVKHQLFATLKCPANLFSSNVDLIFDECEYSKRFEKLEHEQSKRFEKLEREYSETSKKLEREYSETSKKLEREQSKHSEKSEPKFIHVNDRIIGCLTSESKLTLTFDIYQLKDFQISVYCVDYNTDRRSQKILSTIDNLRIPSQDIVLSGDTFRKGQWIVWKVNKCDRFFILAERLQGPNCVISAVMFDPVSEKSFTDGPKLVKIDNETQGNWRGVYGKYGGYFFGRKIYHISSREDLNSKYFEMMLINADTYHWKKCFDSSDCRALQAPSLTEIEKIF